MRTINLLLLACGCLFGLLAAAAEFSGEYALQSPDGVIRLNLAEDREGQVTGTMSDGVSSLKVHGRVQGDQLSGRLSAEFPPDMGFSAQLDPSRSQLNVQIYPLDAYGRPAVAMAEYLTFARSSAASARPAAAAENVMPQQGDDGGASSNVFVNGKALTSAEVKGFERQYQTRLVDGRFWYDDKCGAWGIEGGPAQGFILPSLPLPGPMPANSSGGGTGIFINGRELHPIDRQTLISMFGTAIPGRYWLDAYGNLGVEGGAFLVNLAVAARQLQQRVTQTESGTVSSGPDGAMFSGRNLSTGQPTFWYSGM